uniref:Uncharacterized protein n=1 Tax=Romanomermis culicivorax TaxID=13658 RepID=A0A915HFI6_ROMCU
MGFNASYNLGLSLFELKLLVFYRHFEFGILIIIVCRIKFCYHYSCLYFALIDSISIEQPPVWPTNSTISKKLTKNINHSKRVYPVVGCQNCNLGSKHQGDVLISKKNHNCSNCVIKSTLSHDHIDANNEMKRGPGTKIAWRCPNVL